MRLAVYQGIDEAVRQQRGRRQRAVGLAERAVSDFADEVEGDERQAMSIRADGTVLIVQVEDRRRPRPQPPEWAGPESGRA